MNIEPKSTNAPTDAPDAPLSPEGRARRDAMLVDLQHRLITRRRRRNAVKAAGILAAPCLILVITFLATRPATIAPSRPIASSESTASQDDARPPTTDPDQRNDDGSPRSIPVMRHAQLRIVSAEEIHASVTIVDDDELLEILAQTGESYGIIKTGRGTIVTHNDATPSDDRSEADSPSSHAPATKPRGPEPV